MTDLYKNICIAIALCALCFGAYSLYKIGAALEKNAIANQHIATAMAVKTKNNMFYYDFLKLSNEGLSASEVYDILYSQQKSSN